MPNPWMIVAAVVFCAALAGGGYLTGRLKGEALCAANAAVEQKKALDENSAAWKKSYDRLDERYKMAIAEGNLLAAQVREKNDQIDQLQADARQEISHVVPDIKACRVPISVLDRINGLSGHREANASPAGHPGTP